MSSLRLQEPFERPAAFDLTTAWEASQRSFAEDLLTLVVTARVPHDRLCWLRSALIETAAEQAIASAREPDADGWCEVTIRAESIEVAHDELLRMGAAIEVLHPLELRRRLARTGAGIASHNR
ncbi:MAG: WYL domain-containing protein [Ilumatobacteraceae bacterium]